MAAIWLRGAVVIALILAIPLVFPRLAGADATSVQQRGLVWWSRILAAVFAAGSLQRTVRALRRHRDASEQ